MLEHLGEKEAARRLFTAIERVTADKANHTPDLGGAATTRSVTDALKEAIRKPVAPVAQVEVGAGDRARRLN